MLYNIDSSGRSFERAARYGVRFEQRPGPPPGPLPFGYHYQLTWPDQEFLYWQDRRELARWDWVPFSAPSGQIRPEQVSLAIARASAKSAVIPRARETPFALRLSIQPPRQATSRLALWLKPVVDGAVSALQAHADHSTTAELPTRLTAWLPAQPAEIERHLTNISSAVLGTTNRLAHIRGDGLAWAPAGDMCLAGELIVALGDSESRAIAGAVHEIAKLDVPPELVRVIDRDNPPPARLWHWARGTVAPEPRTLELARSQRWRSQPWPRTRLMPAGESFLVEALVPVKSGPDGSDSAAEEPPG